MKSAAPGRKLQLQPREFRLLEYLMRHAGQVVTRTMLLENVWDYHFDPQTNVIDVHISRLRSKIDKGFRAAAPAYRARRGLYDPRRRAVICGSSASVDSRFGIQCASSRDGEEAGDHHDAKQRGAVSGGS